MKKINMKRMSLKEIEDKGVELNNCLHHLITKLPCSVSKYRKKCRNKPVCLIHYKDFECKKYEE